VAIQKPAGARRKSAPKTSSRNGRAARRSVAASANGERIVSADENHTNNRLFFRLFQAANLFNKKAHVITGSTTSQGAVLGALSRYKSGEGLAFGALAEYLGFSRQNLDGVIKGLERKGYVERITDPGDGRIRIVRLTAKGRIYFEDLITRVLQFYASSTRDIDLKERKALSTGLGKLVSHLHAISIDDDRR
jgi:DNA-binding MarR family transcriptional regulator